MKLSKYAQAVYNAEICPYCGGKTKVVTGTEISGKEYKGRKMIACVNFPECDSYVGTHDNGKPLGRLANQKLRDMRKAVHERFDELWKDKYVTRGEAYNWLSKTLNIPLEYTHIGYFSIKTCILAYIEVRSPIAEIVKQIKNDTKNS